MDILPNPATYSQFAFPVTKKGSIKDLTVSVDFIYNNEGIQSDEITLHFEIFKSLCGPAQFNTYSVTPIAVTIKVPSSNQPLSVTLCGQSPISVPVEAGERVMLRVSSESLLPPRGYVAAGINASVVYQV